MTSQSEVVFKMTCIFVIINISIQMIEIVKTSRGHFKSTAIQNTVNMLALFQVATGLFALVALFFHTNIEFIDPLGSSVRFMGLIFFAITVAQLLLMWAFGGLRGGGADFFFLHTLLSITFNAYFDSPLGWYWLGALSLMSYLRAGWVKFTQSQWRRGLALSTYSELTHYDLWWGLKRLTKRHQFERALCWMTMTFELSAGLMLIFPRYFYLWAPIGVIFHWSNAYFMGLNRFFWTWLGTYPAIYYLLFLRSAG